MTHNVTQFNIPGSLGNVRFLYNEDWKRCVATERMTLYNEILCTLCGIWNADDRDHCIEPSESGFCGYCETGWYGDDCNDQCLNCNTGGCNQTTGICQQCAPGYYSANCSIPCPLQCRESYGNVILCDRESGRCSEGCKPTWWGSTCENRCSNSCRNSICLYRDGSCHLGCEDGLTGKYCNKTCSIGCGNSTCYPNGACVGHCNIGYYGQSCDRICSDKCIARDCVLKNNTELPVCTEGCVGGWQPPSCDVSCKANCTACNVSGACLSCEWGYWGIYCESQCSRCLNNSCSIDGNCTGCRDEWYGSQCSRACPKQCSRCRQNGGACITCHEGDVGDQGQCVSASTSWRTVTCATVIPILVVAAVVVFVVVFLKYRRKKTAGHVVLDNTTIGPELHSEL
ncbi:scavenger receptor class F member 1-like isoform X2 [Haliotis asinina]|uniref:scavenger receptor class F member 1-like isoform X2 n=1 Tax=Haliotis asinina TaxID=109174 RepID=UPI0035318451